MARDSGRYDAFTDTWIDQQVQIDFAWGNIPMQPNDDRGEATLDPSLDSHIIATSGYEGFPAFITGEPYDDTVTNAIMPNIVGMTQVQAEAALAAAGFSSWNNNTTTSGANSGNDGKVASQYPGVGTVLNVTDQPQATYYDNPGVAVPNILGMPWPQANSTITGAGFVVAQGAGSYSTVGGNDTNVNKVKSQSPTQGTIAAPGSDVNYVLYGLAQSGTVAHMEYDAGSDRYFFYPQAVADYVSTGYVGSTITIANFSAIPAANGNYVIDAVVADNAWNTGGQKIWLRKGSFTWSGAGTSAGSTWTLVA